MFTESFLSARYCALTLWDISQVILTTIHEVGPSIKGETEVQGVQLAQSHRAGKWQTWSSNASTLLLEPSVPIMKCNVNCFQAICNLAGVLIPQTMTLRAKDSSLYDMIERTSNKSQET